MSVSFITAEVFLIRGGTIHRAVLLQLSGIHVFSWMDDDHDDNCVVFRYIQRYVVGVIIEKTHTHTQTYTCYKRHKAELSTSVCYVTD